MWWYTGKPLELSISLAQWQATDSGNAILGRMILTGSDCKVQYRHGLSHNP